MHSRLYPKGARKIAVAYESFQPGNLFGERSGDELTRGHTPLITPSIREGAETITPSEATNNYQLDVYIVDGRLVDVRVDGESVFPTWFKLEFKESGEVSAKVKGVRISSRRGDTINIYQDHPAPETAGLPA